MSAVAAVLAKLPPAARITLAARLSTARRQREAGQRFAMSFPDGGPLRRELYPKSTAFFAAGARYLERAIMGGNRVGKSSTVAYELASHLTGRYPEWWVGRRFDRPIAAWAAGDDAKSVRESTQMTLLGPPGAIGTGMVPPDAILSTTRRQGVADAVDTVLVKHASGGTSRLTFKSYDMRREAFQGAHIDAIWLDEEAPGDVYSEALTRLLSTVPGEPSGVMMAAFTPLRGLSDVVLRYLPGGKMKEDHPRYAVLIGWDDVPHLSGAEKAELEAALMPHEREARTKGIPSIGSGAIYPVPESYVTCKPFEIPAWFRRCYALDVGWNRTAAVWAAHDYESDVVYLYSELYISGAEPAIIAQGIKARGDWIPGVIDPAARGRAQKDGEQLLHLYRENGLATLEVANNAVEAGIYSVWERLSSGRLKVFANLENWFAEFRIYRRDEKGAVVKEKDHLMDASRYLVMSGLARAAAKPSRLWTDRDLPRGVQRSGYTSEYDPLAWGNR